MNESGATGLSGALCAARPELEALFLSRAVPPECAYELLLEVIEGLRPDVKKNLEHRLLREARKAVKVWLARRDKERARQLRSRAQDPFTLDMELRAMADKCNLAWRGAL